MKLGLNASMNPYFLKTSVSYFCRIALSAGIQISGAKHTEPPVAAGAIVPSSFVQSTEAPRAAYDWNFRSRSSTMNDVSLGPSHAVNPQIESEYPRHLPGFSVA